MKETFSQEKISGRILLFLIVYLTGPFGVHKFVKGKKGMGFVYLFTFGLLGFGWFVDFILSIVNIFKPLDYFNYYEKVEYKIPEEKMHKRNLNLDVDKSASQESTSYNPYLNSTPERNYVLDGIDYKKLPDKTHLQADVVMLNSFNNNPRLISSNINDYAQYYVYQYNVNPIKLSQRLLNEGFLSKGISHGNLVNFISSLKVPELKNLLKNKQLKVSGKKEQLVNLVQDNYTVAEIEKIFPTSTECCFVSNLGKDLLNKNNDLILLHQKYSHFMIKYDEYYKYKKKYHLDDFYEICLRIFDDRTVKYTTEKQWGFLRNTFLNIYDVYITIKDNDNACRFLIKSLYIDLSGMYNNNLVIELDSSSLCLSKCLLPLKNYYKKEYLDECLSIPLPFTFFNMKSLEEIIIDILNEQTEIEKYKTNNKPLTNSEDYTYFDKKEIF